MDDVLEVPSEDWHVVFYARTGTCRLYPTLDALKRAVTNFAACQDYYKSAIELQRRFDHAQLEELWRKVYRDRQFYLPKSAIGKLSEFSPEPPDTDSETLAVRLWEFLQRTSDRVQLPFGMAAKTKMKDHYKINLEAIDQLMNSGAWKEAYPKQARQILEAIRQQNQPYMLEKELDSLMTNLVVFKTIKTKQKPWTLFQWYRPQFIDNGLMSRGDIS